MANHGPVYGLDAELARKNAAKLDPALVEEARVRPSAACRLVRVLILCNSLIWLRKLAAMSPVISLKRSRTELFFAREFSTPLFALCSENECCSLYRWCFHWPVSAAVCVASRSMSVLLAFSSSAAHMRARTTHAPTQAHPCTYCRLANKIQPGSVKKINKMKMPFVRSAPRCSGAPSHSRTAQ